MNGAEPATEIVAALVWDVPRLRSGSESAQQFVKALTGKPERWWDPGVARGDPLGRAALAVMRERAEDLEEAAPIYIELANDPDPWVQLLGTMLQGWSSSGEGVHEIRRARALLGELNIADELGARLLAKLTTFAFDRGESALGRDLLAEAIGFAPAGSRLERALGIEGMNADVGFEWSDQVTPDVDPLVDYPWIDADSLDAARRALGDAVEMRARRLWTYQFRFGGDTALDRVLAAEVQATWAGALWLRRPIRRQLGAQLLGGAAGAPNQWAWGVIMWALGGGKDPERAYTLAEPSLDQESTDFIVRSLADSEVSKRFAHRFLSVAVEAWDAVSDETFGWVMTRVEPRAGDHPTARQTQRLWAVYAARLPDEWVERFAAQPLDVRASILEVITAGAVNALGPTARQAITETAAAALPEQEQPNLQVLRALIAASSANIDDGLRRWIDDRASAGTVARLVHEGHAAWFDDRTVDRVREQLLAQVEREEAREGQISFGPEDARTSLALLAAGTASSERSPIEALIEGASDAGSPAEHLLHARNGLALLRRVAKLTAADLTALRAAKDPQGLFPEHGAITPELLAISRLRVLAENLSADEVVRVIGACRSQDARVRQLALSTCAEALSSEGEGLPDEGLAWALIGGLFDPVDEVVAGAVSTMAPTFAVEHEGPRAVATDRFASLLEDGSGPVRAAVAAVLRTWDSAAVLADHPAVHGLLLRASNDRSWMVRASATSE